MEAWSWDEDLIPTGIKSEFELLISADNEKSAMADIEKLYKDCKSLYNPYYCLKAVSAENVMGNLTQLTWAPDFFDDL
ncbi:hypothetical protein [Chitinophaga sp. YR573]|uniref:hypothetical protein n=1 Tax=Chitinophaga sp. YR573 TaxID=1881040 RepID=UPI00115F9FB9|nr:hypothetical protein [Chitinophaga sp. YR573]